MSSGFKINKQAVARMMRDIQREVNKHPVTVPVKTETPPIAGWPTTSAWPTTPVDVTNFNGPVILGDANGAQLAWNTNGSVDQTQNSTQEITPGFEEVAGVVARLVREGAVNGLDELAQERLAEPAAEILNEVVVAEPDRGKIRTAVDRIKGVLAPVALGMVTGAGEGAAEWAKTAISSLDTPF